MRRVDLIGVPGPNLHSRCRLIDFLSSIWAEPPWLRADYYLPYRVGCTCPGGLKQFPSVINIPLNLKMVDVVIARQILMEAGVLRRVALPGI